VVEFVFASKRPEIFRKFRGFVSNLNENVCIRNDMGKLMF